MKLSELIEQTLIEISTGVKNAREASKSDIAVAPKLIRQPIEITHISFDVTLEVTESDGEKSNDKSKIGGELKVASILSIGGNKGLEIEGSSSRSSQNTQRISFQIPVVLSLNYNDAIESGKMKIAGPISSNTGYVP